MQRHAPGDRERVEEVAEVLGRHVTDLGPRQTQLDMRRRPAGKIDHDPGQGLVEGREGMREPADAATIAQSLVERLAEREAAILDRVVVVDVQVPRAGQLQIEAAVLDQRRQHVVEEAEAGIDRRAAAAVEVESQADLGLGGVPLDRAPSRVAHGHDLRELRDDDVGAAALLDARGSGRQIGRAARRP